MVCLYVVFLSLPELIVEVLTKFILRKYNDLIGLFLFVCMFSTFMLLKIDFTIYSDYNFPLPSSTQILSTHHSHPNTHPFFFSYLKANKHLKIIIK